MRHNHDRAQQANFGGRGGQKCHHAKLVQTLTVAACRRYRDRVAVAGERLGERSRLRIRISGLNFARHHDVIRDQCVPKPERFAMACDAANVIRVCQMPEVRDVYPSQRQCFRSTEGA